MNFVTFSVYNQKLNMMIAVFFIFVSSVYQLARVPEFVNVAVPAKDLNKYCLFQSKFIFM